MRLTYTGNNSLFLSQSFFDPDGALSVELVSFSQTEVVLTNTAYPQANVLITFRGTDFSTNPGEIFVSGNITSIEFDGLNIRQATITEINWSGEAFRDGLLDVALDSDFAAIAALINASGPVEVDASGAQSGFDFEESWGVFLPLLTQPVTFTGSMFDDSFAGTPQNDVVDTKSSVSNGDRIAGSEGDDLIIFDLPDESQSPGYYIDYDSIGAGMTIDINGVTNTGSATGPGFVDTFQNVQDALSEYLGIEGTSGDDTFTVRLAPNQVYSFIGGAGTDSYNFTGDGAQAILDFFFNSVTSGINLDIGSGVIANDGFGNTETLDISGTPDAVIVLATNQNDSVVDGTGDQLIRFYDGDDTFEAANLGDDSIDGGTGTDTVVFDGFSQGEATLSFEGAITAVTDRDNPFNSTALLAVELLDMQGDGPLELSKHDGIGLISAEDLTALTELYIAYFDRAADALGLSFWATAFVKNGFSLREIADLFFTQAETQALYAGVSDGGFVQAVYNNVFGRDADDAGFAFWSDQLSSGNVTESAFILELLAGARAPSGDPADVQFIENKTDLGLYFAVIQGQNNLTAAQNVMDIFDGSQESLLDAAAASADAYDLALASDTELLMPVIGVVDSPFFSIS